jgi:hypothetical protein
MDQVIDTLVKNVNGTRQFSRWVSPIGSRTLPAAFSPDVSGRHIFYPFQLVIIDNLDLVRAFDRPGEANKILIIEAIVVLPSAITRQSLQADA